jgi:2-polyprenyl-6-methoxyphenol hydroxylase-like FAD-dependent oxidoreductase
VQHRYNFMLALLQAETERTLEQRLAEHGIRVEWSTEFTGFDAAPDRVRARLVADGEERVVEARYLIGADGAHSAVRHALGLAFRGTTDPSPWWLVDVRMDWPFGTAELSLFARPAAVLGVIPIEPGLFRLVSNGPEPLELLPRGSNLREEVWRSAFRISYRQVASYQVGRVFLAGDAAHVHSPVGARGMNLGIEDGTVLARKIVQGGLETYSAERHPVGARDPPDPHPHPPGHGTQSRGPLAARSAVRARDRPKRRRAAGARQPDPGHRLSRLAILPAGWPPRSGTSILRCCDYTPMLRFYLADPVAAMLPR